MFAPKRRAPIIAAAFTLTAVTATHPGLAQMAYRADISSYFSSYYQQQVVDGADPGSLDFLRDAARSHQSALQVLKPSASRSVIVDRHSGYLQIDDSSGTDQILTMGVYDKADSGRIIVAGISDCADACDYAVEIFIANGARLKPLARTPILPVISPAQFIQPGHPMPKALASIEPKIDYLPARTGTTLTLKPWYGYEAEEQMDAATRSAIRNVTLEWDRNQGIFVQSHKR